MTFRLANINGRAALVDGDQYFDLERVSGGSLPSDVMAAIARADELHGVQLAGATPDGSVHDVELGPAVPAPRNCFAIGLNYRSHAAESNMELPENPLVFTKFPSCLVGPTADVEIAGNAIDYEAELVVVIGTGGRNIAKEQAWSHVAGLTAGQDISDRKLQFAAKPPHFDLGKSRDTYGPIGPWIVSTDVFANKDDIAVRCFVNDEQRQGATTADLVFDVPFLIEYLSSILTLSPGDVIFTGTPDGVGASTRNFLKPGDVIRTEIDGIGVLTNRCVMGAATPQ